MSALSLGLNRVLRPLRNGVRSARPEEFGAVPFPASPFRPENETTDTDCPSARSAGYNGGNRLLYGKRLRGRSLPFSFLLFCRSRITVAAGVAWISTARAVPNARPRLPFSLGRCSPSLAVLRRRDGNSLRQPAGQASDPIAAALRFARLEDVCHHRRQPQGIAGCRHTSS
jgi:hypothetical protein